MQLLLCGTNYGSSYLRALWHAPGPWRLGGVLSRGSTRSRQLARQAGVAHYTAVDQVPRGSIDAACVAVPGDAGTALTEAWLARGVAVLAEHPLDAEPIEQALDLALAHRVPFHVNSHFGDLETIAPWIEHVRRLCAASPPRFVHAQVNPRTLYSVIDILARALGSLDPASIAAVEGPAGSPLRLLQGTLGHRAVPMALQCQHQVSQLDDGSATLISHQIGITFDSGTLLLGDTFGPVVWIPRLTPETVWQQPAWSNLGPAAGEAAATYCEGVRARANLMALTRMAEHLRSGTVPASQRPEHLLTVARVWRTAIEALGPLEVVS